MKLSKITFTGADNNVDPYQLYNISDVNSRVEWGILIYPKKYGTSRYPSLEWINNFLRQKPSYVKSSAHLCGTSIYGFTHNPDYRDRLSDFDRIQLNIDNYSTLPDYHVFIGSIMDFTDEYNKPIILQYNRSNNEYINEILEYVDVNVLFDNSRGKGILSFDVTNSLFDDPYSGYAGGITPENVNNVLMILETIYDEDQRMWIDMESGIRTRKHGYDEFDENAVMQVLHQIYSAGY